LFKAKQEAEKLKSAMFDPFHSHKVLDSSSQVVIAVGGGKGGIGKSFISSSLAISFARMGKKVTLIDLDLGSANLHTFLGSKIPPLSLSDFVSGQVSDLNEISVKTEIDGLRFISGFNDTLNMADLGIDAREKIKTAIKSISTPYVILDLGAGTSENTLDFFLSADQKIVAVVPEPTSIENAYRFIKTAYYRKLKEAESNLGITKLIEAAMDNRNQLGIKSPSDLIHYITKIDPIAGARLVAKISDLHIELILNQVRTRSDIDLGTSIKSVCRKYFGIEAYFAGYIEFDNAVWQSLRKKRPLLLEHPYSNIVSQFMEISKNVLNAKNIKNSKNAKVAS
jgi:flagellar biosynthesis protein FlhG